MNCICPSSCFGRSRRTLLEMLKIHDSHNDNIPSSGPRYQRINTPVSSNTVSGRHYHMGQAGSGEVTPHNPQVAAVVPTWLQSSLHKQAGQIKQIVTLSYEHFLQSIKELNKTAQALCDISGKQLQFIVKKGTDNTIFWKGTVRVRCHKVNCENGSIESTRLLNLKQYIHLYNEITRQSTMATVQPGFCASIILTELDLQQTETEECCICMDRKSQVILVCSHTYCEQCIDEWHVNHKTCPICRATVDTRDDSWVLTEKPDQREIERETTGYLLGLADRTGTPSHSPTE